MEESRLKSKEELRIEEVKLGTKEDQNGYCGCPNCGSYDLTIHFFTLDAGDLMCNKCKYSISGDDPEELANRWNNGLKRDGTEH